MENKKLILCLIIVLIFSFISCLSNEEDFLTTTIDEGKSVEIIEYIGNKTKQNIRIPSKIKGLPVTSIGKGVFQRFNYLKKINIPNSVINIGNNAFSGSNLERIIIPKSVINIGNNAFASCSNLASVIIGNGVLNIGWGAFSGCHYLTNVFIGNSVIKIEGWAFSNCLSLSNINIGNSVLDIGEHAFYYCPNLTNVTIGSNVTNIGYGAFLKTGLTSIIIPNSVINIENVAFSWCNLTSITIPNSVTNIGIRSFYFTPLTDINVSPDNPIYSSIDGVLYDKKQHTLITFPNGRTGNFTVPDNVIFIEDCAFELTSLSSITIPNNIKIIGDRSFIDNESLILNNIIIEGNDLLEKYLAEGTGTYFNDDLALINMYKIRTKFIDNERLFELVKSAYIERENNLILQYETQIHTKLLNLLQYKFGTDRNIDLKIKLIPDQHQIKTSAYVNIDGEWKSKYDENGHPIVNSDKTTEYEYIPISSEVLKEVEELLKYVIGYDANRGDFVLVTSIPF